MRLLPVFINVGQRNSGRGPFLSIRSVGFSPPHGRRILPRAFDGMIASVYPAFDGRSFGLAFRSFTLMLLVEPALPFFFLLLQPRDLFAPLLALVWRSAHEVLLHMYRNRPEGPGAGELD